MWGQSFLVPPLRRTRRFQQRLWLDSTPLPAVVSPLQPYRLGPLSQHFKSQQRVAGQAQPREIFGGSIGVGLSVGSVDTGPAVPLRPYSLGQLARFSRFQQRVVTGFTVKELTASTVGVGLEAGTLALKHNLSVGPIGVGTVSAAWGSFVWGSDGWNVVRLSVQHNLVTNAIGVGRPFGSGNYQYHLIGPAVGVGQPAAILGLRHNLSGALVGVGYIHGPAAPTALRLRFNTREGTFVWPKDSFEAARRDQAITRVEAEKI